MIQNSKVEAVLFSIISLRSYTPSHILLVPQTHSDTVWEGYYTKAGGENHWGTSWRLDATVYLICVLTYFHCDIPLLFQQSYWVSTTHIVLGTKKILISKAYKKPYSHDLNSKCGDTDNNQINKQTMLDGDKCCERRRRARGLRLQGVGWKIALYYYVFNNFIYLFIWLHWVFVAAPGLSLVVASGGYSSLQHVGFSLQWLLLLQRMDSRCMGFSSCSTWAQ